MFIVLRNVLINLLQRLYNGFAAADGCGGGGGIGNI